MLYCAMHYKCMQLYAYILMNTSLDYRMSKKSEQFVFRTTEENHKYVVDLASSEDLTPSYVLNRMINYFREKGIDSPFAIK